MKYMLLTFCAILFSLVVTLGQEPLKDFAGGEGTVERPYLIENASQLAKVKKYTGERFSRIHFKLTKSIEFKKADFEPNGEFYNKGKGWEPIGNKEQGFESIFDGNGYTIKGLISRDWGKMGLFGVARRATIKNVILQECEYYFEKGNVFVCVGGVVGQGIQSVVEHCRFTGKITIRNESNSKIGGIVGDFSYGKISCCFAGVAINAQSLSDNELEAGGIVGYITGGDGIKDCYAEVVIKTSGSGSVGGIAGEAKCYDSDKGTSNIIRCYVKGTVNVSGGSNVGGIVGYVYGSYIITNNFSALTTIERKKSQEYDYYYIGKVVGRALASNVLKNNYVFPAMVMKGKRDREQDSSKGTDGMRSHDYEKKDFWESLGFVFGNGPDAPWVFRKNFPILYGFEEGMSSDKSPPVASGAGASFQNMKKVFDNECLKQKKEAQDKRTLFVKELESNYDALLTKEMNRIGETNLELAAAIQLEQSKLKQAESYSFADTEGAPEIVKLRAPFAVSINAFEKENAGKLKKEEEALVLKYAKALSALQKKCTQNKDFAQALEIKKEIDSVIKGRKENSDTPVKENADSQEWIF